MNPLRAVVIGAGWAGEGHTLALRDSGVDVVAMCGRTPEPTRARARQLDIPEVRFDVRQALEEFRPDIVAIGTPGRSRTAIWPRQLLRMAAISCVTNRWASTQRKHRLCCAPRNRPG